MKRKASLVKLFKFASFLLIPVALIALSVTLFTMRQTREERYDSLRSIMDYQASQLDNGYNQVSYYLASTLATDGSVRSLQTGGAGSLLAAYWVEETLGELTPLRDLINPGYSFMVTVPGTGLSAVSRSALDSYEENRAVEEFLLGNLDIFPEVGISTLIRRIGGVDSCLLLGRSRGVYLAGWISLRELFSFMDSVIQSEDGFYVLLDENLSPITGREQFQSAGVSVAADGSVSAGGGLVCTYHRTAAGIGVIAADGRSASFGEAGITLVTVLLLCGITAGACFYFIAYFRRNIQRPLQALQQNVSGYVRERRFTRRYGFAELDDVANAFEELEAQVGSLKIDIYEEKLRRTRTELEFLQNQIKPHFLVNCFNIIIGMAEWEKFDQIQDFCMLLSSYVRYTLCDGFETVTLQEELRETCDFLKIQDIRFDSHSALRDFEAEDGLLDCQVPPLMLLTLAENSVKHNKFKVDALQLTVTARHIPGGLHGLLRIDYQDNGVGLGLEGSRQMAQMLEAVRESVLGQGENVSFGNEHIGLQNLYRRLLLLYGERARVELMPVDRDEGFKIRMTLPMVKKSEIRPADE